MVNTWAPPENERRQQPIYTNPAVPDRQDRPRTVKGGSNVFFAMGSTEPEEGLVICPFAGIAYRLRQCNFG